MKKSNLWKSILIVAFYFLCLTCGQAKAADEDIPQTGSCGTNAQYAITENQIPVDGGNYIVEYTITITGTGKVSSKPWAITKYKNNTKSVVIGEGIESIPSKCFTDFSGLEEVTIPSSMTKIPSEAFKGCMSLESIDLNQVTSVGSNAFNGCVSLEEVTGNKVETFGASAFVRCNFTTFTIPAALKAGFEPAIVGSCQNLSAFACAEGQKNYSVKDGILYSADGKTLIAVPENYSGELVIDNAVETIYYGACSNNTGITKVVIPEGVHTINDYAFENMAALTEAEIYVSGKISLACFSGCSRLQHVTFGNKVVSIDKNAFSGCTRLTFPEIPDSITMISKQAFAIEDMSTVLPKQFKECGQNYVVYATVRMVVSEEYDAANRMLLAISTDKGNTILLDEQLCDMAWERALQSTLYYKDGNSINSRNPLCVDGVYLKERYTFFSGDEIVYQSASNEDVGTVFRKIKNESNYGSILEDAEGVGIACIETGDVRYWVIETSSSKAGTLSSWGTGSHQETKEVSYVKSFISDATVFTKGTYTGREGELCDFSVYFGYPDGCRCVLDPTTYSCIPQDDSILSREESGRLRAIYCGTTTATVQYGKLSCIVNVSISPKVINEMGCGITQTSCLIGDCFGLQFFVPNTVADAYDTIYLSVKCPEYTGNTVSGDRTDVMTEYTTATVDNTNGRVYTYYGLAAKEMSSKIEVQVCGLANGELYYYETVRYSLKDYATTLLKSGEDTTGRVGSGTPAAALFRLASDMLTYGAEAQKYFDYHTNELATSGLETEILLYGTGDDASASSDVSFLNPPEGGMDITGFALSLENRTGIRFYVYTEKEPVFEVCAISSTKGTVYVPASEWIQCGQYEYRIDLNNLAAADYRTQYSAVITNANTAVSNVFCAGVEDYVFLARERRMKKVLPLVEALLRFGDSAAVYGNQ